MKLVTLKNRLKTVPNRSLVGVSHLQGAKRWDLHFVQVQSFADATAVVRELGELWPGEYVIDNEETGERVFVTSPNRP